MTGAGFEQPKTMIRRRRRIELNGTCGAAGTGTMQLALVTVTKFGVCLLRGQVAINIPQVMWCSCACAHVHTILCILATAGSTVLKFGMLLETK